MKKMINITLKTIQKVKTAVLTAEKPISLNFIATDNNLHPYRAKKAIELLLEDKQIKCIENSTGVTLYFGKRNRL